MPTRLGLVLTARHQNVTTTLTCALFATPLTIANATNCGDAETTFIADSYGFVKPDPTVAGV